MPHLSLTSDANVMRTLVHFCNSDVYECNSYSGRVGLMNKIPFHSNRTWRSSIPSIFCSIIKIKEVLDGKNIDINRSLFLWRQKLAIWLRSTLTHQR